MRRLPFADVTDLATNRQAGHPKGRMFFRWHILLGVLVLLTCWGDAHAADARFDLVGPKVDVRVTRNVNGTAQTLPIASVPNLQPGDRLWIHPDLPPTQSVHYLLICSFLRGSTNPPPEDWFYRIDTWKKEVRQEGVFITVPAEAQQVVLFMAPETGGDFSTLKNSVRGRPGVFVRAAQDLNEAGFEQARIERYLAEIRRVPPTDPEQLQRHSDLLARTLALKPNTDCFKRPMDQQFTCLTQTGTQTLLDDGHSQNIVSTLSNGQNSEFIQAASYTALAGAGAYSAYVGAIVDLVRIMGALHTAQYQYIPAIAFPQGESLNLRLNTPPSFHNPKSVLVIGLPGIHAAQPPPLRPAHAEEVACLLQPRVILPIDGAPLVFSTEFATHLVLHLNTPPGAAPEADIPLLPDAFEGGLALQRGQQHHVELPAVRAPLTSAAQPNAPATATITTSATPGNSPVTISGTIRGEWGFDPFTGPSISLQQQPGGSWHLVNADGSAGALIAGKSSHLYLESTGSACVHEVTATEVQNGNELSLHFERHPEPDHPNLLEVALPHDQPLTPGDLKLQITQFGQPQPDSVAAQTFSVPPRIESIALPAGGSSMLLTGADLQEVQRVVLGDLNFQVDHSVSPEESSSALGSLHLNLPAGSAQPATHSGEKLIAQVTLVDGRHLSVPFVVSPPRPSIALIGHTSDGLPGASITLSSPDDLPLTSPLRFILKSRTDFPRNGQIEIETLDGTLRAVLTLAPSGGLVLQDPHTVVASLDPLHAFGPSAFGGLRLRAVFPPSSGKGRSAPAEIEAGTDSATAPALEDPTRVSDWLPLGTLVRLPTISRLLCPSDVSLPCTLMGSNLFLLQAVSADPAFSQAEPVPDGFTGTTLSVPHPAGSGNTLFVRLRDHLEPIDPLTPPTSITSVQASTTHGRASGVRN